MSNEDQGHKDRASAQAASQERCERWARILSGTATEHDLAVAEGTEEYCHEGPGTLRMYVLNGRLVGDQDPVTVNPGHGGAQEETTGDDAMDLADTVSKIRDEHEKQPMHPDTLLEAHCLLAQAADYIQCWVLSGGKIPHADRMGLEAGLHVIADALGMDVQRTDVASTVTFEPQCEPDPQPRINPAKFENALIDAITDLDFAAGLFGMYEEHHIAKGTPKSAEKARVNKEAAERLRATIARVREVLK